MEVILKTCSKIENPPKPSSKDAKTILVEMFFTAMVDNWLTPLVSSRMPDKKGLQKTCSIEKVLNIGKNKLASRFSVPELFKIERTTENRTTKPPIITTV